MASSFDLIAPAGFGWAVTPSDSVAQPMETRSVYIGGDGNLSVEMYDPTSSNLATVTFTGLVAGQVLPIKTKKIRATLTTATNIVGVA